MLEVTASEGQAFRSIWSSLRGVAFEQRWIDAGGVRTRVLHAGEAGKPVLVMLHGTASQAETFCNNLGPHAEHFDCYAIDMLGTGYTDKPDRPYEIGDYVEHLVAFLDAIGAQKASILGVSLGAWVAARFAIDYPERTDKITLVAPAGHNVDEVRMARIKASRQAAAASPTWDSVKNVLERLVYDRSSLFDDIIASRLAFYRLPEMQKAMQNILVLQEPDVRAKNVIPLDRWAEISAPALVIGGNNDNEADYKDAKAVADLIPGSRLEVIDKVGHWGHFEVPELFNPMNVSFLRGTGEPSRQR
ncbi:MAG TPA: alpha/beta hydrolase [Devosia sp.]|nr:alpha/beta hydrolase [Devosia sp.]